MKKTHQKYKFNKNLLTGQVKGDLILFTLTQPEGAVGQEGRNAHFLIDSWRNDREVNYLDGMWILFQGWSCFASVTS